MYAVLIVLTVPTVADHTHHTALHSRWLRHRIFSAVACCNAGKLLEGWRVYPLELKDTALIPFPSQQSSTPTAQASPTFYRYSIPHALMTLVQYDARASDHISTKVKKASDYREIQSQAQENMYSASAC